MSANVPIGRYSEAGFTLIEMLVVMMILAVVATIGVPLLSNGSDGLRLQAASSELATALRITRSAAIARNLESALLIDVDRRLFRSPVISERSFARDIDAKLTFASGIQSARSEGGFQFFPDGSSTGGDVTLSLHGKETRICVHWLTGEVRERSTC
jgi:general secretion pathway protein H